MRLMMGGALVLALTACGGAADEPAEEAGVILDAALYASPDGRSGLCVGDNNEASFILYAADSEANCMAEGRIEGEDGALAFVPRGDDRCRISLTIDGDVARMGSGDASCDYYCGSAAALDDRELVAGGDTTRDPVDPAGEPIC